MAQDYNSIIRKQLHGNKYLDSGELNPAYDRQWGLKKGRVMSQARSYAKQRDLFIPKSTTASPIEYIATGILADKSQYGFKEIKRTLMEKGISDSLTRSVDLSVMGKLIEQTSDLPAVDIKYNVNGQEVTETIQNPSYYAKLYAEGVISRQDFFDYVKKWEDNSTAYQLNAYGTDK